MNEAILLDHNFRVRVGPQSNPKYKVGTTIGILDVLWSRRATKILVSLRVPASLIHTCNKIYVYENRTKRKEENIFFV
jgi:hypothetical protein